MHVSDFAREKAEEAAAARNFGQGPDFVWHAAPDDPENWIIVTTTSRDAGLIAKSNTEVLAREMAKHLEWPDTCAYCGEGLAGQDTASSVCPDCARPCGADVVLFRASHWGCGWVEGYAIRMWHDGGGELTAAWLEWCELMMALEEYALLDDEHHSAMEFAAIIESIERHASVGDDADSFGVGERTWPYLIWDALDDEDKYPDEHGDLNCRNRELTAAVRQAGLAPCEGCGCCVPAVYEAADGVYCRACNCTCGYYSERHTNEDNDDRDNHADGCRVHGDQD